jgi:hypothetical protein
MIYDPKNWFWIVAENPTQAYSSAARAYVAQHDAAYAAFAAGGEATRIDTFADLIDVLRAANVPPYHKVSTYAVVRRLETAGLIEAADIALSQNKTLWRRFYTVGNINADDPDSIAFLQAIGADPMQILAPDP